MRKYLRHFFGLESFPYPNRLTPNRSFFLKVGVSANPHGGTGFLRYRNLLSNYIDLHILKPGCGIGLHRHRDNQEVFLIIMMTGKGLMVTSDWNEFPNRERSFEIRTLAAGHLSLLKSGQLHWLINATDEDISLFMFGGYD